MQKIDFFLGLKNKEIITLAGEKGFQKILFVKEIQDMNDFKSLKEQKDYDACLLSVKNVNFLRRMIDKASNYFNYVLVLGLNDEINRAALKHKKVFGLVAPEFNRKEDFLNQRNSGLNHVLCKIAKETRKMIIFRFSDILNKKDRERAVLLGRIMQNLKLCRKYKVSCLLINFSSSIQNIFHVKQLKIFEKILLSRFRLDPQTYFKGG
ncbi:MAG: hypothetical protein QXP53_02440 [Candidatus Pacearchaeota archaeon]